MYRSPFWRCFSSAAGEEAEATAAGVTRRVVDWDLGRVTITGLGSVSLSSSDLFFVAVVVARIFAGKMTPPKSSIQISSKGLRQHCHTRYNSRQMDKSLASTSSYPRTDDMFEASSYNTHSQLWDVVVIDDEQVYLPCIEVANNYFNKNWAILQHASGNSREYYEEILRVTKFTIFTHDYERDSPSYHNYERDSPSYQFSELEILKSIPKRQWEN
ncbi:hypothetical protein RJ640_009897 [Escallonia rubra]|uniref:Uncharacterized protein n=1 Tax=Escallonia rubra TaxID=112253 RepID=A0AA88RGR4_9ASTE|nr:hypothetical protein RJ640_009897 [Escallonia rubra]